MYLNVEGEKGGGFSFFTDYCFHELNVLCGVGSHHKLHPVVRERASKNLIKGPIFGGSQKEKPDIGDPIRVLLRPGDAVLAHQRLGHSGGINLHKRMRKNLYFRILHKEHDKNWEATLNGHLFTQYEGLHHLIDDM